MANEQLANLGIGLSGAIAGGLKGYAAGEREGRQEQRATETRREGRELFKQRKRTADAQYERQFGPQAQSNYDQQQELHQQQMAEQGQALRVESGKRVKREMNEALEYQHKTGRTDRLTDFFKNNPDQAQYLGVLRVDPAVYDPNDQQQRIVINEMLADDTAATGGSIEGVTEAQIDPTNFSKRLVKTTNQQGDVEYRDIMDLVAATNPDFVKYMDDKERTEYLGGMQVRRQEQVLEAGELGIEKAEQDLELGPQKLQLERDKLTAKGASAGKTDEATRIGLIKEKIKNNVPLAVGDQEALDKWEKSLDTRSSEGMKIEKAIESENVLTESKFLEGDGQPKTEEERRALKWLRANRKLDSSVKKHFTESAGLVKLADEASSMTPEQTGLVDTAVRKAKEYFSDTIKNEGESRAAYQQFTTDLRHTLFGSALTEQEIAAFNEAYGNLNMQLTPLLTRFKKSLEGIKSKYDATRDISDKYLWRNAVGTKYDDLSNAITRVDRRIAISKALDSGKSPAEAKKAADAVGGVTPTKEVKPAVVEQTKDVKPVLTDIWR